MKPMDLFDELTYVDEAFILEAHETPAARQTHFCFRRVGALLAAVIAVVAMSVAVVATMAEDAESKVLRLWNLMLKRGYNGYFAYDENNQYELHQDTEKLDGREIEINQIYVYNLQKAELQVDCEGETMELRLEAMVLMADGQVKYKSRTIQGNDKITVTLDNLIAGEPGTIVLFRPTIQLMGQSGWKTLPSWNRYIADDFGFQIPVGTDVRFPDTKRENYDYWETFHPTESDREECHAVFLPGKSELIATIK